MHDVYDFEKCSIQSRLTDEQKVTLDLFLDGDMAFKSAPMQSIVDNITMFYYHDMCMIPAKYVKKYDGDAANEWVRKRLLLIYKGEGNEDT